MLPSDEAYVLDNASVRIPKLLKSIQTACNSDMPEMVLLLGLFVNPVIA